MGGNHTLIEAILRIRQLHCSQCQIGCDLTSAEVAEPKTRCPISRWAAVTNTGGPPETEQSERLRALLDPKRVISTAIPKQTLSRMEREGPGLWNQLHSYAASYPIEATWEAWQAAVDWLAAFTDRLPCGECRAHWLELLKFLRPDLTGRDAFFRWTVTAHNLVNVFKATPSPVVALCDALAKYTQAA